MTLEMLLEQWAIFLLVLVRILAFFTSMPLFSYRNVPAVFKIGLGVFFALILAFAIDVPEETIVFDNTYFLLLFKELLVGLSIGFIAGMLMYAVQVAGMFLDIAFGFLVANVIDPQTGTQSPLMGGYLYTFALLFLLATDGHHLILDGIYYSYSFIPIDQLFLPFGEEAVVREAMTAFTTMFAVAFQMSFPVVGSLFLIDVALGMMSRAVPQMNVFVVGLPLKIFAGLPILAISLPAFFFLTDRLFDEMFVTMRTLMELFGGS